MSSYKLPVTNYRALVLITLGLVLCCGCKRHSANPKEAINGAFGWALGVRLPAAFEVQTNSTSLRYIDPRGKVPPFEHVVLDVTLDRTIFAITGTLTQATPETFQALENSLTESLKQKYVFKKKTNEGGVSTVQFGDDAREVILAITIQPRTLALCYRDTDFARRAQAELAAKSPSAAGSK